MDLTVIRPVWNPRRERWAGLGQDARERPLKPDSVTRPRTQLSLREVAAEDCLLADATPGP